jgi:Domain of unknown function (DUF4375)
MLEPIDSYWELVEPVFTKIDIDSPASFFASIADVPRPVLLLYAAHFCLSEVHNGGFLQFFKNSTGLITPEAIEGFDAIGMQMLASVVRAAADPLGVPYPRERDSRWDALLVASGRSEEQLKDIFEKAKNLYLAFVKATETLPLDQLSRQAWVLAETESGGFQDAATRYAQGIVNNEGGGLVE